MHDSDEAQEKATFVVRVGKRETLRITAAAITLGTRSSCDVVLAARSEAKTLRQSFVDPVAAGEHCRVSFDGECFWIEDRGSATGTFVNGLSVEKPVRLTDGARIVVGLSEIVVSPAREDGRALLTLQLKANSFHVVVRNKNKGEFKSDTDRWARAEVRLGRFVPLRVSNCAAFLVALCLLVGVFVDAIQEPLLEPGALCESHALLFEEGALASPVTATSMTEADFAWARERRCQTCHEPLNGTPMTRCARCHGELMERHHPFNAGPQVNPDPRKLVRAWQEHDCNLCHVDHRGRDSRAGGFVPHYSETPETCDNCHAGTELARSGFRPQRNPQPDTYARRVNYSSFEFGHDDHLDESTGKVMDCQICHEGDAEALALAAQGGDDRQRKDYLAVPFETCARCHVRGQQDERLRDLWPPEVREDRSRFVWTVEWHGSEDNSKCERCHAEPFEAERRMVARVDVPAEQHTDFKARYQLELRSHREHFIHFAAADTCETCHRRGETLVAARPPVSFFWHAVHVKLPEGKPEQQEVSEKCRSCHTDRENSAGLRAFEDGFFRWAPEACAEVCHRERPTLDAPGLPLQPEPLPAARRVPWQAVEREDFPHREHLDFEKPGLEDGCFTCHEFKIPPGGMALAAIPATKADARNCNGAKCHEKHDNVGGGFCRKCHAMRAPDEYNLYLGRSPPAERAFLAREWPTPNAFSHYGPGHRDVPCTECHDVESDEKEVSLQTASNLEEVPIPHEGYPACRRCHLARRERFHWR